MNSKKNIRSSGKIYDYLLDPALRQTETGHSELVVEGMDISGVSFQNVGWRNIRFLNCDFIGSYEIKLSELQNCTFENCRFAGIISWGVSTSIRFVRCQAGGQSNVIDFSGSSDVRFEFCVFLGANSNPNNWGAIGSRGDATFIGCKAKWFDLAGYKQISLDDCETHDVGIWTDSAANSGATYESAAVLIKNSKLLGKFRMVSSDLLSITVQDTVLEYLDLNNAEVKGDVLMERVKGGFINAGLSAKNFTLRNSEVFGNGREASFVMAMDSVQQALLENTHFGTGLTQRVNLGPGRPLQENEWSAMPFNSRAIIRNCTMPIVDASWLESQHLRIENNIIGSLDISRGRLGQLEILGNTLSRTLDLTNTQARESRVQGIAKGQAKLEGSNVRTN